MAVPDIVWLRPGVGFNRAAAISWARAEARLSREIRTASTYRDYEKQLGMHNAWNRYVASGRKPALYPGHSMALHPDNSEHCTGDAADTPEWTSRAFLNHMREHGWIQTAPNDPTERHHLAYRAHLDKFRNEPVPAALLSTPINPEEDDMKLHAIRNGDGSGSIGIINPDGTLDGLTGDEYAALNRAGVLEGFHQETDGAVWNILTARTARLRAVHAADVDEAAVAARIAPLIVGPIIAALGKSAALTEEQVQDAAERAIRDVFADAANRAGA